MKLRSTILSLLAPCLFAAATAASATPSVQGRQVSVQVGDVQQYLDHSFPQTHEALGGLLALTVAHPQVAIPAGERLNLAVDLALATAGSTPTALGKVALSSALRYDASKQGVFLEQPSIDDFHPASAGGKLDANTRQLLNAWLLDYARKQPVYKIDPAIANALGAVQVESAGVRDGRLIVTFNQDIGRLLPAAGLPGN